MVQTAVNEPASGPAVVLTLDVGTSSVRCCAFDTSGQLVPDHHAARSYEPRATPDGGSELDAPPLLEHTLACLEAVAESVHRVGLRPVAVAVCTFWHAFLAVDAEGRPLTPILLWNDMRAAGATRALRRLLDEEAVHRRTGCVLHPSYLPARLRWLAEAQPERFARAERFLSFGEYLEQALFGSPRCSVSMASGTGLFDLRRQVWDGELLDAVGLAPERLAPVVEGHPSRAGLRAPHAGRLPTLRDVPFFPAIGDGAANHLGSGAGRADEASLMIGTSAAMRLLFPEGAPEPPQGLWRYLLDARRGLVGGALSNGGNLYAWLQRTLRLPSEAEIEAALRTRAPGQHGLTVLPFLSGERNPDYPLAASAVFAGLHTATQPLDLLQAGMEAVAYRLAAIADRLHRMRPGLARFVASGGLLRSPAWVRILTDVLGLPVTLSLVQEASSRGTALLALEALGYVPSALAVPPPLGETLRPDAARHARYEDARRSHEALYARLMAEA